MCTSKNKEIKDLSELPNRRTPGYLGLYRLQLHRRIIDILRDSKP